MLGVRRTVVALLSLSGIAVVRAQNSASAVSASFDTDVRLEPVEAWRQQYNDVCLSTDVYTTTINATASLTFTGNRVQIYGMRNNASGRFTLQVDGQELHTYNLRSDVVQCELFVDDYLSDGTHNLTLTLVGADNSNYTVSEGHVSGQNPVFHLTNILYYAPNTASSTAAPLSSGSGSSATQKGAIAGVVIGGIIFISLIVAAILFTKRKQRGPFARRRHAFDPTRPTSAVYITELSPRSPRSDVGFEDAKFAASPYARMEDDDGGRDVKATLDFAPDYKADTLAVPTLAYSTAQGRGGRGGKGLRSRSRSPAPPRVKGDGEDV